MTMAEDVANCVSGWFWEGVPGAEPTAPGHPPGLLQGPTQEKKQSNNTQQLHFSQRRIASRRATRNYIISKPVMFRNIEQSADVPRAKKKTGQSQQPHPRPYTNRSLCSLPRLS